jgi:hypothetical protein
MIRHSFLLSLLLLIIFSGCYVKPKIYNSNSYLFLFKSKSIKFYDTSYVLFGKNFLEVNVYNLANKVASITIREDKICLEHICYSKHEFNSRFLTPFYNDELLENIIQFKPIYSGLNLEKNDMLSIQKIKNKNVDIMYEIKNSIVKFKDIKNRITIKMEKI